MHTLEPFTFRPFTDHDCLICHLQVQTAVDSLRESAVSRSSKLQDEMTIAHDFTSRVRGQWGAYVEETEKNYHEDTATVEREKSTLEDGLKAW